MLSPPSGRVLAGAVNLRAQGLAGVGLGRAGGPAVELGAAPGLVLVVAPDRASGRWCASGATGWATSGESVPKGALGRVPMTVGGMVGGPVKAGGRRGDTPPLGKVGGVPHGM